MNLISFLQDGKLTIVLNGEIDHHCAKRYICLIKEKIETYIPKSCVLDFSDVTFMDSSGIAVIINALRCMNRIEGKISVCGMHEQPKKVFITAGMDKLVEIMEE